MDHADVREQLELAAVEPGGLDRVMAGDTADAAALVGHLAGCDACMEEFGRLRRSSHLVRQAIASQAPPELRARTLALVAAVGRQRAAVPANAEVPTPALSTAPIPASDDTPRPAGTPARSGGRGRRGLGWVAAAAAIVVLTLGLTWTAASLRHDEEFREQAREIAALGQLTAWQLRIEARDDAERVVLASTDGAAEDPAMGSLAFSPGSREIVVTATGLEPPDAGREYRCWVSVDGQRERLGKMYFSADIAYWVGRVDILDQVRDGAVFGVSLTDVGGQGDPAEPVLSGTL